MYYPYVRGRQYELLALKELVLSGKLSENIIPIIEPVKLSPTLIKTLDAFNEANRKICFIINPDVGSFISDNEDPDKSASKDKFIKIFHEPTVQKAFIVKHSAIKNFDNWINTFKTQKLDWVVINNKRENTPFFTKIFQEDYPQLTFVPDESQFRRSVRRNRGLLEDRFEKMERNADYSENVDEFFSEDHLFFSEYGYKAFSDYSVVGSDYLESGFAPYAVAIHIVYFDEKNNLRVRHFVSDNNSDIQNPAGKFYEAVSKLASWVSDNNIQRTQGIEILLEHFNNQTYPGLGSVKKLSLMHHLELMGTYLNKED